ncbi:TIGR03986 family type III CRISPR-associated RAMP protein [Acrocarpospora catenulata]|uniref:TIGR03986 family type III CRISPR-associated RAMP protein n=1 Tax=Acrocarpospora catenulata TaxID=2836182 RepID=UPI001BD98EDF|nr:TIGR03986 family CRISPR-associated RAMP protein [Acrocarpospora catenulata]
MAEEFLNPYTFVPAFPREDLPAELGDRRPPDRDRLSAGCWTGRIAVRLTVETPLLLLDTARGTPPLKGESGHLVYPVRIRNGRPHLAATSVKGMLRAAYETITNSRFGVFDKHDAPFGFRRDAGFALGMVPVYVAGPGTLYRFQMATLRMYEKSGAALYPGETAPVHMQRLRALISGDGRNGTRVDDFVRSGSPQRLVPQRGQREVEGIAYVTGPNIEGKTRERFFYLQPPGPGRKPEPLPLAREWSALVEDWNRLMNNYRASHDDQELFERSHPDGGAATPGERIGSGPGQLAWSPHIYDQERTALKPGTVCYARQENGRVVGLYPVMVPRDVYPVTPAQLLPASLAPASCYDELSPADRVFGWVAPNGSGVRQAAYRGRLRIGPVECDQETGEAVESFDGDGVPLAILSKPKPQQGRFYVAESADRPDAALPDRTPKEKLYQEGRGLRGRKAYWHHAGLDRTQHWSEGQGRVDPTQARVGKFYREFRRPWMPFDENGSLTQDRKRYQTVNGAEQRDSQNRSVKGWVRPGTTFRFTIDVRDLEVSELGALAWLLTLPPGHFQRLGYGRPLGFGSVRLDVDVEHTELHSGEQYTDYYRSLSATLPRSDAKSILDQAWQEFERLVSGSPQLVTVRDAMLAVARGNPEFPVHDPRVRPDRLLDNIPAPPDPRGQNYEWFTANEQLSRGDIAPGRGRSLPFPANPPAQLPVYPAKDAEGGEGVKRNKYQDKSAGASGSRPQKRRIR